MTVSGSRLVIPSLSEYLSHNALDVITPYIILHKTDAFLMPSEDANQRRLWVKIKNKAMPQFYLWAAFKCKTTL